MTTQNSNNISIVAGGSNSYLFPALTTCTLASSNKVQTSQVDNRAFNGTYSNLSTSSCLMVMATGRCVITLAGGNAYMQAKVDTANPPTVTATGLIGIQTGLLNEDNSFQIVLL